MWLWPTWTTTDMCVQYVWASMARRVEGLPRIESGTLVGELGGRHSWHQWRAWPEVCAWVTETQMVGWRRGATDWRLESVTQWGLRGPPTTRAGLELVSGTSDFILHEACGAQHLSCWMLTFNKRSSLQWTSELQSPRGPDSDLNNWTLQRRVLWCCARQRSVWCRPHLSSSHQRYETKIDRGWAGGWPTFPGEQHVLRVNLSALTWEKKFKGGPRRLAKTLFDSSGKSLSGNKNTF